MIWIAVIAALAPTLMGLASLIASLRNKKAIGQIHVNSGFNGALEDILLLQVTLAEMLPVKTRKRFLEGVAAIRKRHTVGTQEAGK
jgi:hypothetical protein